MGMAASQARFLGLTARKTNVEYEGQQINQQRTALSNQTASYYNNLLGMNVPQPPAVQDYTKTIYTFTDGALNNEITSLIARVDGSFMMSYNRSYIDNEAIVSAVPSRIIRGEDGFYVGAQILREMGTADENDPYYASLSEDNKRALLEDELALQERLNSDFSQTGEDTWLVRYVQNTSSGVFEPTFYNQSVLEGATYDNQNTSVSFISAYKRGQAEVNEEIKGVPAYIEQDSTGRYINVSISDENGNLTTYALTTSTVTDDKAYTDAMNQYEFDKAQYDKDIQEINAKIEIIQTEDRDLETRLKQLDTEQDAITNELDAVSKVIQKNVESSFKTFG